MDLHYQKYWNTVDQFEANNWVDSNCAEISFLNVGDGASPPTGANVTVLGYVLKPGFGVSFDGNDGEIDVTKYFLTFTGAGARNCQVFRKMYV